MMMKKAAATIAGAIAISAAASAQQPEIISNPRGTVANFDVATIGPILTEMGAVWQANQTPDGRSYMVVRAGDFVLHVVPMACQSAGYTNCIGMNTLAIFSGNGLNYQTITAFNQKYSFSTAGVLEGGSDAYLSRYEIADYGIARGNVAASVVNLHEIAKRFRDTLSTSAKTVSQEGYAEDMAARLLNARGVVDMTGAAPLAHTTAHEAALEETAEIIKMLVADQESPRNKIENINAK